MFNPNDSVTLGLGIKMNKFFLRLAFAVAVLLPMPSALAADLDVPSICTDQVEPAVAFRLGVHSRRQLT